MTEKQIEQAETITEIIENQCYALRLLHNLKLSDSRAIDVIMVFVAEYLAKTFHAAYAFTQLDEIVLLITASRYTNRDQLVSEVASAAGSIFNLNYMRENTDGKYNYPNKELIYFQCKLGQYETVKDAFQSIVYTAHQCEAKAISYQLSNLSFSQLVKIDHMPKATLQEQIKCLETLNLFPLPEKRLHGTLFAMKKWLTFGKSKNITYDIIQGENIVKLTENGTKLPNLPESFILI